MYISKLETPCLILDKGKLQKNIQRINDHIQKLGVALRPHGKTAKSMDVMTMALEGQKGGIAASTLSEAEYAFGHGVTDIIYAVGIAPVKLDRVAALIKKGCDLKVLLDNADQARFVAAKGMEHGITIPALIELDSDGHRSGVTLEGDQLVTIGRILHESEGSELKGVLTHAGESYQCRTTEAIVAMAEQERACAVGCAEALRAEGLPCPIVSVGSSPTAHFAQDLTGVTEMRPGVYMFQDLVMAGLGVCDTEDIAISVLASVIGHQEYKGWVLTDAGWMAMSRDRGSDAQDVDQGYGLVCDINGKPYGDLIVSGANQEHGILSHRTPGVKAQEKLAVGDMVRVLPNHACATAAMYDRYHVVNGSTEIIDTWPRINGW